MTHVTRRSSLDLAPDKDSFLNGLIFDFDVGTGLIGENKTGVVCPRRLCLRNAF